MSRSSSATRTCTTLHFRGSAHWLRARRLDQRSRVVELVDLPALPDQSIHNTLRQVDGGLVPELVLELRVAERPAKVAERFPHEHLHLPAVDGLHGYVGLIFRDPAVARGPCQLADAPDRGIVHRRVGVLLDARFAAHQADGGAMIDGELALQALGDAGLVA